MTIQWGESAFIGPYICLLPGGLHLGVTNVADVSTFLRQFGVIQARARLQAIYPSVFFTVVPL